MGTRAIPSTEAQNNFGRILDDVVLNRTRYVITRRGAPQVVVLGLSDLVGLLQSGQRQRGRFGEMLCEMSPGYELGQSVDEVRRADES